MNTTEQWEEEFDKKISEHFFVLPNSHLNVEGLREFVKKAISSHHNQLLDRVVEVLDKKYDLDPNNYGREETNGFNLALTQSKEAVNKLRI